jgi:hypothetical protein
VAAGVEPPEYKDHEWTPAEVMAVKNRAIMTQQLLQEVLVAHARALQVSTGTDNGLAARARRGRKDEQFRLIKEIGLEGALAAAATAARKRPAA